MTPLLAITGSCAALSLWIAAFSASSAANLISLEPPSADDAGSMEHYREQLYEAHLSCSDKATDHVMSAEEATACAEVFLALKLSFLNGASRARYRTLSPPTRALANAKGYAAYRAWLHRRTTLADASQ